MNRKLTDAIARVGALPEDRQEVAAALLLEFLDSEEVAAFTPEGLAELELYLDELAAEEMVKSFFARAKSRRDRSQS